MSSSCCCEAVQFVQEIVRQAVLADEAGHFFESLPGAIRLFMVDLVHCIP